MTAAGRHSQPLFHTRCTRLWRPWFPVYDVHHICISNYTAMAAFMSRDFSLFSENLFSSKLRIRIQKRPWCKGTPDIRRNSALPSYTGYLPASNTR